MFNRLILQCRMVRNPELKKGRDGKSICEFCVAWNDKKTKLFQNCVAYDNVAEVISKYFVKGQELIVCGRLFTQKWVGFDGINRQQNKLTVYEVHFCKAKNQEVKDISEYEWEDITDEQINNLPY